MTWDRIVQIITAAAIAAFSWTFTAGSTWNIQSALPGRVDKVEERLQDVEKSQNRVEGKLDTVIALLRGRK